ncbi:DNA repair protein RecO [Chloroflexota bacterium]|nr:DNA repair protein RecO [Chloroflexota bacterium]
MPADRLYRTDAVVLRRHNTGEADRILTLFTPGHGKVRAIVKGVRRAKSRMGGHIELFTHVNVLIARGRSLDIVTQAEMRHPFGHLRDDLWKTAYASYVAELIDHFAEERHEGPESDDLFTILVDALGFFNALPGPDPVDGSSGASGPDAHLVARAVELKVLTVLGYAPELFHCVHCRTRLQPGENRISAPAGGALCPDCGRRDQSARVMTVNAIKAMRLLTSEPLSVARRLVLTEREHRDIELALRAHLAVILERQLRTGDVLDRLRAALPWRPPESP